MLRKISGEVEMNYDEMANALRLAGWRVQPQATQ